MVRFLFLAIESLPNGTYCVRQDVQANSKIFNAIFFVCFIVGVGIFVGFFILFMTTMFLDEGPNKHHHRHYQSRKI